ncbi:RCC1-like domain-containing protein [Nonomuraea cavernae]|uniref:RCC1-like domain-containing protein n=1 Tax=Nonomuraea cavernae TaxID=2045107 RepID=UPI0033C7ACCC
MAGRRAFLCLALCAALAGACGSSPATERVVVPTPPAGGDRGTPRTAGGLWTTGWNADGQLGRKSAEISSGLDRVTGIDGRKALDDVVALAAGGRHSIAVTSDGSVVAWGANDLGQLGDGTTTSSDRPVPVRAADGGTGQLSGAVAVSANSDFSMALLADGTVVTWGKGDAGQRGIGTRDAPLTPTTVKNEDGDGPLKDVTAVSADGRTELALLKDGSVVSWGANNYGMLGDGTTKSRSLPVPVHGVDGAGRLTGVTAIAMGGQHGLALLQDGHLVSWGYNDMGQLGSGDTETRLVPAMVSGPGGRAALSGVISMAAAEKHNFAILRDRTVVAWGNNTAGQLGDGTTELRTTPAQMVGTNGEVLRGVHQVYAGEAYGAAILDDGTVRTWGANGKGQLGSGDRVPRSRPGPVVVLDNDRPERALTAAAGERHLLLLLDATP